MATTKVILNFPWSKNKDKSGDAKDGKDETTLVISESALKIAKKELREDKTTREQALAQMRDWLRKNYDVENVRSDDCFLLRFLRSKKFSVPMAQQQLLKYLNMRKVMGHLSSNLDYLGAGVSNIINNGYIIASPIRDKLGRRTILYFASKHLSFFVFVHHNFDCLNRRTQWSRILARRSSESSLDCLRNDDGIAGGTNSWRRSHWRFWWSIDESCAVVEESLGIPEASQVGRAVSSIASQGDSFVQCRLDLEVCR